MSTQTIRQSTILIAAGKFTRVYASLEQVPAGLKRQLIRSTSGANSATILLADRAGREEIVRALRGMPSNVQSRLVSPKLPWTEAFARKQARPSPKSPVPPADPTAFDNQFATARSRVQIGTWAGTALTWTRAHWPELLLPVGMAIGLWALLNA